MELKLGDLIEVHFEEKWYPVWGSAPSGPQVPAVTVDVWNYYDTPSRKSVTFESSGITTTRIERVPSGTRGIIVDTMKGHLRVKVLFSNSQVGWVMKMYLRVIQE